MTTFDNATAIKVELPATEKSVPVKEEIEEEYHGCGFMDECPHDETFVHGNELICDQCGLVIDDDVIDDWTL